MITLSPEECRKYYRYLCYDAGLLDKLCEDGISMQTLLYKRDGAWKKIPLEDRAFVIAELAHVLMTKEDIRRLVLYVAAEQPNDISTQIHARVLCLILGGCSDRLIKLAAEGLELFDLSPSDLIDMFGLARYGVKHLKDTELLLASLPFFAYYNTTNEDLRRFIRRMKKAFPNASQR